MLHGADDEASAPLVFSVGPLAHCSDIFALPAHQVFNPSPDDPSSEGLEFKVEADLAEQLNVPAVPEGLVPSEAD
eukprot:10053986-Alexandrium_andersonii.AAC.1